MNAVIQRKNINISNIMYHRCITLSDIQINWSKEISSDMVHRKENEVKHNHVRILYVIFYVLSPDDVLFENIAWINNKQYMLHYHFTPTVSARGPWNWQHDIDEKYAHKQAHTRYNYEPMS